MARKKTLSKEQTHEKIELFNKEAAHVYETPGGTFLEDNFILYSWALNLDRALVGTSGLKASQRRILYTFWENKLTPHASRSKVATISGKVLAYHPHSSDSVDGAIKNMGRMHTMRVPMIDGKGDFGSPGNPGAASRYIEARLSEAGWLNVQELSEHAVPMQPNYDDTSIEPIDIPVRWPVAIINSSSGLGVGYASNIPSHNPSEIMDALKYIVQHPKAKPTDLLKIVKGPDFNMGGTILSKTGIEEYLLTGAGNVKIRGNYTIEPRNKNALRIEFHEIPVTTDPEKIITEIQKAIINKGVLEDIISYKDLSDLKHPIRIVIDTKPGASEDQILYELFQNTSLMSSIPVNMTTIVNGKPAQTGILPLLQDFITFRISCITNKSKYAIEQKSAQLNKLEGLLKVLIDIDKVIHIVRNSNTSNIAKKELEKTFDLNSAQSEYILSLQLRRLTKTDTIQVEKDATQLKKDIEYLNKLISDDKTMQKHLLNEFDETKKIIGDNRKTNILDFTDETLEKHIDNTATSIAQETTSKEVTIVYATNNTLYQKERGTLTAREQSQALIQIDCLSGNNIILITNTGLGIRVPVLQIPESMKTNSNILKIVTGSHDKETCIGITQEEIPTFIATASGKAKITSGPYMKKNEFKIMGLKQNDNVIIATPIKLGSTNTIFVNSNGKTLKTSTENLSTQGPTGSGSIGIRIKEKEQCIFACPIPNEVEYLALKGKENSYLYNLKELPTSNLGLIGNNTINDTPITSARLSQSKTTSIDFPGYATRTPVKLIQK